MRPALAIFTRPRPAPLIAAGLALLVLLGTAVAVLAPVTSADAAVVGAIHDMKNTRLTDVVLGVTALAATDVVLVMGACLVGVLVTLRHWRGAVSLAVSVLATQAVVAAVKLLVSRPRPDSDSSVIDPSGFSFPSAHSASAVALYATLALVAATAWRGHRRLAACLAALAIGLLVGASRVYLGAHYPTDVLAGWLTGAVIAVGAWQLCAGLPYPPRHSPQPA